MSRVTASLVLYNTPESQLVRLLESLEGSSLRPELLIVDNSPAPMLNPPTTDWITYIKSERNCGYGSGHNIALNRVLEYSDFHFVLNPDVYFGPFELERMLAHIEQEPTIGLMMPRVLYPDGSIQYLCKLLPTPFDLLIRRFVPTRLTWMMKKRNDQFELRFTGYREEMDVPYLSGCFMFLRTDALKKVGLFDERFFMYPEDLDLSRRIHAEFRSVFFPGATVVHDHARASYRNWRSLWVHMANMSKYFNKWGWIRDSSRRKINRETLARLGCA